MSKLHFDSDYMEGAHENILNNIQKANYEHLSGYGTDKYTNSAKEKIKSYLNGNEEIYFLVGGTQTNQVIIDSVLEPYEGAISPSYGHIATHESGAIEFTGHKVLSIPSIDGKIYKKDVEEYCSTYYADENQEHMVKPGLVYISFPNEYGLIYSKQELKELREVCDKFDLKLFCDGARLGYGLVSNECDITLKDLSDLCDVFYIGGTKVGALFGEAVVFTRKAPTRFVSRIKQHGALLAKGFITGIEFDTLFTDNLYFEISKNAIKCANKLRKAFDEKGYKRFLNSETNQIFVILDKKQMEYLSQFATFGFWNKYDNTKTVVRFATSWATKESDIDELISHL